MEKPTIGARIQRACWQAGRIGTAAVWVGTLAAFMFMHSINSGCHAPPPPTPPAVTVLDVGTYVGTVIGGVVLHRKMAEPVPEADPIPIVASTTAPVEKARKENPVTEDQRTNSRIIRGLEALDWGGGFFRRQVSGVTTLTAVMQAYGEDTSYEEVMGFSGIAFMTRMKRDWCPSSVCYNFDDNILSSFGYKRTRMNMDKKKCPDAATKAKKALLEGIGRGIPIPYCDGEDSLIVGYKDDGNTFVCMPYAGSKDGYVDMPWPRGMLGDAWWIDIIERTDQPKDRRTRIVDSLRTAVSLAKDSDTDDEGNPYGFAAYESWIEALESPAPGLNLHGNAYCYAIMLSSRDAAAKYMRMVAAELGEPSALHLRTAAEYYDAEQQRLWDGRDCVKHPWDKSWTPENRKIEADIMNANLKDEKAAISQIGKAVKWAEEIPGQVRPPRLVKWALRNLIAELPKESPYIGGGVPFGVVQALRHAGVDIDFEEYAAATGWTFSFGYRYDDISTSYLAVRGNPAEDGPYEVFAFLPDLLGFDYEMVPTRNHDKLWQFVKKHVDAGTPLISEHIDGGLVYGYREKERKRQVWFDATVGMGWTDLESLDPSALYVLVKKGKPQTRKRIAKQALERAVQKASAHEWKGTPQGVAALEAYLADVKNPNKDFKKSGGWFCWSTFERLNSRRCCAVWLQRTAELLGGNASTPLVEASDHYQEAHDLYEQYRKAALAGEPTDLTLQERARTPEKIALIAPILEKAIESERAGIEEMRKALALLN